MVNFRKVITLILSVIIAITFSFSAFADVETSSNAVLGAVPQEYLLSASVSDDGIGIISMLWALWLSSGFVMASFIFAAIW